MRKSRIFMVILTVVALVVLCVSCTQKGVIDNDTGEEVIINAANIDTIEIEDAETLKEVGFSLSTFKISDVKIRINFIDETSVLIDLTESMIRAEDKAKLSVPATHTMTINCYGKTVILTLKLYTEEAQTIAVTFYGDDGKKLINTQYVKVGETVIKPQPESKPGYSFIGWKDRETGTVVTDFAFTKDTGLVAYYLPDYYDVEYFYKIGEKSFLIETKKIKRNGDALAEAPSIPLVSGYSNGRWEDESSMKKIDGTKLSFYAVYDTDKVLVTFEYYKHTEGVYSKYDIFWNVDNETEGIVPPSDINNVEQYIFLYWYTLRNGKRVKVDFPYKVTGEVTFTAYYVSIEKGTEGIEYEPVDDYGYKIVGYHGEDTTVSVPNYYTTDKYGKRPIVQIADDAFAGKNISTFYVAKENTYFRVHDGVLYDVNREKLISYPSANERKSFTAYDKTEKIAPYAFYGAKNLTQIILPAGINEIGEYAFAECVNLEWFEIPADVTAIAKGTFYCLENSNMKSLRMGNKITEIKDNAFFGLNSLTELQLSATLESLGNEAFVGCDSLRSVGIANTNKTFTVFNGALYKNNATQTNPYQYLYLYPAKYSAISATEYAVNKDTRMVMSGAFNNVTLVCIDFETDEIEFQTRSIVAPSLYAVRFAKTKVIAAENALGGFLPEIIYYREGASLPDEFDESRRVKYTNDTWTSFNEYYLGNFSYVVDENRNVTIVGYKGTDKSVTIPTQIGGFPVVAIGKYAFADNVNITEVEFSDGIVLISEYAFYNCKNLTKAVFGKSRTSIENKAFAECSSLNEIHADDMNVVSCGDNAFDNVPFIDSQELVEIGGLLIKYNGYGEKVVIPNDVTIIYNDAFADKYSVNEIDFSQASQLRHIGKRAFANLCDVESVIFPHTLEKIEDFAFSGCTHLASINNLAGVEVDENKAFYNTEYKNNASIESNWQVEDGKLIRYKGTASLIVIPERIKEIAPGAFADNAYVETVIFNSQIKEIFEKTFFNCAGLKKVQFTASLTAIREHAFANCVSLYDINFEVASSLKEVAADAFDNTAWLNTYLDDSIIINDIFYKYQGKMSILHVRNAIKKINEYAFYGNKFLKTVYMPESLETIDKYAFAESAVENILFPGTFAEAKHIGDYAFYNCKNILSIDLSYLNKLSYIGEFAFYGVDNETHNLYLTIPRFVSEIGEYAFSESCVSTIKFAEGSRLERIKPYTFFNCANLKSVVFEGSASLYEIGESAFADCVQLTSFFAQESKLAYIDGYAFANCVNLEVFRVDESKIEYVGPDAFFDNRFINDKEDTMIFVGNILVEYKGIAKRVIIPATTTIIGKNAFAGNEYLEELLFENDGENAHLSQIQENAFFGCKKLTTVKLPNSVKTIGRTAFARCESLKDLVLNDGLSKIEEMAFSYCDSLEIATIPQSVEFIGGGVFTGCVNLAGVEIGDSDNYMTVNGALYEIDRAESVAKIIAFPNSGNETKETKTFAIPQRVVLHEKEYVVDGIGDYCFAECRALNSIAVPASIKTIGKYAFKGISTSINSDNSQIGVLGEYSFAGYEGNELTIPQSVISIEKRALSDIPNVKTIVLPDGLKNIADEVFYGSEYVLEFDNCTLIEELPENAFVGYKGNSLKIPSGVKRIGKNAFNGVTGKIDWAENNTINVIGEYAFAGYKGDHIEIPVSVTEIGNYAFFDCDNLDRIIVPSSVKTIGEYAFGKVTASVDLGTTTLSNIGKNAFALYDGETVVLPNTVTALSERAFYEANNLKNINLADLQDLTTIEDYAFYGAGLIDFTITEKVTVIGRYAFAMCQNLSDIDLNGEDLREIGFGAFFGCDSLRRVSIPFVGETINANSFFGYIFGADTPEDGANVVPSTISEVYVSRGIVRENAFLNCASIKSLTFGESVEDVKVNSLLGCETLEELALPFGGVLGTLFGAPKFNMNNSFVPVTLKTVEVLRVNEISDYAFYGCTNLIGISLPDSMEKIGESAFRFCGSIEELRIGKNVNSIGNYAFVDCGKLENIIVDVMNETYLDKNGVLFSLDSSAGIHVAELVAYPTAKTVDAYVVESVYRGEQEFTVTSLAGYAFYKAGFQSIDMPVSIQKIGEYAFAQSAIESVRIATADIGVKAFNKCTALKDVYIDNIDITTAASDEFGLLSTVKTVFAKHMTEYPSDAYLLNADNRYEKLTNTTYKYGVEYDVFTKDKTIIRNVTVKSADMTMGSVTIDGKELIDRYLYVSGSTFRIEATAKPGYAFYGWFTDAELTQLVTSEIVAEITVEGRDIELYAGFKYIGA